MRHNQIKQLGNYHFIGKNLGKGHFAFVELALHTITDVQVAVKITNLYGDKSSDMRRNYFREVSLLKKLNHPGIVKIYETLRTKDVCCLVLEYVTGGDLLNYVREKKEERLDENQARYYFKQIASVLEYLHKKRIVHRDLKMENILLQGVKRDTIKVIDFGLSNVFSKGEFLRTKCGSPEYAAPELFEKDCKYGTEVDIWSLGIILYGMLVGQLPFRNDNYGKLVCLITKGLTDCHQANMKHLSPECVVLLSNILQPDSGRRYSLQNIMLHSWTCKDQIMITTFTSPVINPRIKQKVVKTVANLLKVTKIEVNLSVDLRKCDSVFAVYSILLQEELEQIQSTSKIVVPLNIQDYDSTPIVADKNTTRSNCEKGRVYRGCVLQKHALLSCASSCERKSLHENTCVIGKRIENYCEKQPSFERMGLEHKETETDHVLKRSSLQEMVLENDQSKDWQDYIKTSDHKDMDILLNSHKHEKKLLKHNSDEDSHYNENCKQLGFCEECFGVSNYVKGTNKTNQSTERVLTRPNQEHQATTIPSGDKECLISDANREILTAGKRKEGFRTGRDKNKNDICPVTCVTLQTVLDMKNKRYPVQRKAAKHKKYLAPEKKGSKLHTIPSKETVNPSRDLAEAIEERLKPCLKNSAASLRQRPHTANAEISRDCSKSKTKMIKVVRDLAARPNTAICSSSAEHELRGAQTQSLNLRQTCMEASTKKTEETSSRSSNHCNNYHDPRTWRDFTKPNTVKVDSWLKDETFQISGKKIHFQDSSCDQPEKTLHTQHEASLTNEKLKTTNSVEERKATAAKPHCSIQLVVGTACLKKPNKTNESEHYSKTNSKDGVCWHEKYLESTEIARELIPSRNNVENTEAIPAWLSKLHLERSGVASSSETCVVDDICNITKHESSHAEPTLSDNLENISGPSKKQWKDSKNTKNHRGNGKNANRHYKNQFTEHSTKKSVRFGKNECVNGCKKVSSERIVKSKGEIVVNKWKTVEKLFCSGEKQTNSEVKGEKLTSQTHMFVPNSISMVTSRHFLVPHPSVVEMNEERLNTFRTDISKDLANFTNHFEGISNKYMPWDT